jgi:hypothetical protein
MVIQEHNTHQQIHEKERTNEDEEHSKEEVYYLAVVLDWPCIGTVDEGINVEGPVLSRRKYIERHHRTGYVLEVNQLCGPDPSIRLASYLVYVKGAV